MPVLVVRSDIAGVFSAIEATCEANGEKETRPIELLVPDDAESLIVSVTDLGRDGFLRGPRDTRVTLVDPRGQSRDDLLVHGNDGQLIFLASEPAAGRWTMYVECGPESAASLNATTRIRGAISKMRTFGRYLRCKTCKIALKAAVIALLAHVGSFVVAGLGLGAAVAKVGAAAAALLDLVVKGLGVARTLVEGAFDRLKEYGDDPVDELLERCCGLAKLCAADARRP